MSKWESVKWNEVVEIKNGRNQKAVEDINGQYLIYGSGGIMGYANDYLCDEDAVIIGRKGNINKPIYVNEKFWNVDTAFGLKTKKGRLITKYLYYFCVHFNFEKLNTTVTIPSLTKSNLLKIQMPLPPLATQTQISKTLDTTTELLAMCKQQLAELDNLIKSTFYDMFGDPVKNDKGWAVNTVDKVCSKIIGGGTPSKSHSEYYIGLIPWVTPKDMKSIRINDSIDHINEDAIENSSAKLIPSNSILMVIRSGILKRLLPVAINNVKIAINQDMKAFITNEKVVAEYLLYYFILMQNNILKNVRAVTADNIEFNLIKNLIIPIPSLNIQTQFAEIVTNIEEQKALVQKAIDETQYLFDSLMSEYFD